MAVETLERALAIIAAHSEEASFVGPVDVALVDRAEALLGLRFPRTYRRFLEQLGAGDIWGEEVYGIVDEDLEDPLVPNGVGLAVAGREDGSLPDHLLPVYDLGDGTTFGLDFSARTGDEVPVVSWHGDPSNGRTQPEAPDFGTFLLELLESAQPT